MKKIFTVLFLLIVILSSYAQEFNRTIDDPKLKKEVLIGYCTKEGLFEHGFNKYFDKYYESYQFVPEYIDAINTILDGIQIVVIMADWCEDSHREIPRFYKIMDHLVYPQEEITLICVNSKKETEDVPIESYKIEKVPTFIFVKDGKEIGRITEKPKESLEKDMLDLLKTDK